MDLAGDAQREGGYGTRNKVCFFSVWLEKELEGAETREVYTFSVRKWNNKSEWVQELKAYIF